MNGLDLRIWPPRAPRARLDGLVFMPRTIDKIRATLPGGHLGSYQIVPGLSEMLLAIVGVQLSALREAVSAAENEEDVALWLREHADTAQYPRANAALSEFRHENVPAEQRAHFESLYPEYLLARYALTFDLIEADDRELYPALEGW